MKREWVVGFMISDDADPAQVILIRKNRPEWQAGRLNGVGGKVEESDVATRRASALQNAMSREFREETGLMVDPEAWHHFASLEWEEGVVRFLRVFAKLDTLLRCRTTTDEGIERWQVHNLLNPELAANATPNLMWLVPLAAHRHDTYDLIDVVESGTTMRKPGRLDVMPGSPVAP